MYRGQLAAQTGQSLAQFSVDALAYGPKTESSVSVTSYQLAWVPLQCAAPLIPWQGGRTVKQ